MYMPGRGSEIRCTLWALSAGAFAGDPVGARRIAGWLAALQNPDGGFGYWEGRGSDLLSTAAAVEVARLLDASAALDHDALAAFVGECRLGSPSHYGHVPGAPATLRAGLQAQRILHTLGAADPRDTAALMEAHRVRSGGFANEGNRVPDLLSTYEAVVTADRLGAALDPAGPRRFLERVRGAAGIAWSPLAPAEGDVLAECLGTLLHARLTGQRRHVPALVLS